MFSEIDFQTEAQHRQATLLAEASSRRMARVSREEPSQPQPTTNRLQTLIRRIAGAPTVA